MAFSILTSVKTTACTTRESTHAYTFQKERYKHACLRERASKHEIAYKTRLAYGTLKINKQKNQYLKLLKVNWGHPKTETSITFIFI